MVSCGPAPPCWIAFVTSSLRSSASRCRITPGTAILDDSTERRAMPAARLPPGTLKETIFASLMAIPSGEVLPIRVAESPTRRTTTATLDTLLAPWRSGYAAACKAVDTGSIPVGASDLARDGPPGQARIGSMVRGCALLYRRARRLPPGVRSVRVAAGGGPVLRDRRLQAIDRPATRWATLIVVALLAALPAAAQARTFKIEGVVTGPPAARGGAVTVPFKVTPRVGRALNLGTRNVSVRLGRRASLRLSGAGASGASRLLPSELRAGDRLKGVTSLSRRARMRLRWHFRPSLKLKRARVIRPAPRPLAPPHGTVGPRTLPLPGFSGIPGPPGTPLGQIAAHLATQASALAARADEAGPLAQKIEAQRLQQDPLETGIEDVTTALGLLRTALDQLGLVALRDQVDALRARVEDLKDQIGPIDSTLGELDGALSKVRGAAEKLVPAVGNISAQVAAIQQTAGAQAVVTSLDAAATSLNGRLDAVEAGLGSLASDSAALIAAMASLATAVDALTAAAGPGTDLTTLTAGVDALEAGFGGLAATSNSLVPVADAIETEAPELEKTVGELCSLVPTACP